MCRSRGGLSTNDKEEKSVSNDRTIDANLLEISRYGISKTSYNFFKIAFDRCLRCHSSEIVCCKLKVRVFFLTKTPKNRVYYCNTFVKSYIKTGNTLWKSKSLPTS